MKTNGYAKEIENDETVAAKVQINQQIVSKNLSIILLKNCRQKLEIRNNIHFENLSKLLNQLKNDETLTVRSKKTSRGLHLKTSIELT